MRRAPRQTPSRHSSDDFLPAGRRGRQTLESLHDGVALRRQRQKSNKYAYAKKNVWDGQRHPPLSAPPPLWTDMERPIPFQKARTTNTVRATASPTQAERVWETARAAKTEDGRRSGRHNDMPGARRTPAASRTGSSSIRKRAEQHGGRGTRPCSDHALAAIADLDQPRHGHYDGGGHQRAQEEQCAARIAGLRRDDAIEEQAAEHFPSVRGPRTSGATDQVKRERGPKREGDQERQGSPA